MRENLHIVDIISTTYLLYLVNVVCERPLSDTMKPKLFWVGGSWIKLFQHYGYLEVDKFLYAIRINFAVRGRSQTTLTRFQLFWPPIPLPPVYSWFFLVFTLLSFIRKSYVAYGFSSHYTTSYSVENFSRALKLCVIVWWCCRWLPACFLVCFYGGCTVARKYQYTRCHFL